MATRRGYYLEELNRAGKNIDMCVSHLERVIDAYKVDYPEVSTLTLQISVALLNIQELIDQVREKI